MDIANGSYRGKVIGYAITETSKGDPQICVTFEFKYGEGDGVAQCNWYGNLKEGRGQEITIDALLVMGLKGNDLSKLADGPTSGVLDLTKEVMVVVKNEPSQTDPNKTFAKIQWVNELSGAKFRNALKKEDAVKRMAGLNLQAAVLSRRNALGYKDSSAPAAKPISSEEVPF